MINKIPRDKLDHFTAWFCLYAVFINLLSVFNDPVKAASISLAACVILAALWEVNPRRKMDVMDAVWGISGSICGYLCTMPIAKLLN